MFKNESYLAKVDTYLLGSPFRRSLGPQREETVWVRSVGLFTEQALYFLTPKFHLKGLRQLRELNNKGLN